jgi:hypothetical protein
VANSGVDEAALSCDAVNNMRACAALGSLFTSASIGLPPFAGALLTGRTAGGHGDRMERICRLSVAPAPVLRETFRFGDFELDVAAYEFTLHHEQGFAHWLPHRRASSC